MSDSKSVAKKKYWKGIPKTKRSEHAAMMAKRKIERMTDKEKRLQGILMARAKKAKRNEG